MLLLVPHSLMALPLLAILALASALLALPLLISPCLHLLADILTLPQLPPLIFM